MNQKYLLFIDDCVARLFLDVFGAAGATWGTSEVCGLRHDKTNNLWRILSSAVGILFGIRYVILQRSKFVDLVRGGHV